MPTRIFIVGTDTAVGKTAVTAALLRTARDHGPRIVPFKPAQSGPDRPSDAERLLSAAGLPLDALPAACPLRYAPPLAPGLADDPAPFLGSAAATTGALAHTAAALDAWESTHQPAITLIEGAGGLHVPMPGGTWQPSWITALAPWTLVVGRAGLGTINHCIATILGLRAIGRPPLGFVLSQASPASDPSARDNPAVVAGATGAPWLGTLPYGPEPAHAPDLLDALLARLARLARS